jgi:superfamily I DNA and/or RNA helicase
VDVGCLSAIHALQKLGADNQLKHLTRFGDPALNDPELERFLFDKQIEQLIITKQAELVEEDPDKEFIPNEMMILRSRKLVCTTLARVCTSDLLAPIRFDMVVIDEASMASLPFIMALASKADAHIVIAGDPMQLPPISTSQDPDVRAYLEEDAFSRISGARSTAELFTWHDRHPSFTSFFDIQYRMRTDMAGLISSIFYEGRLRSSEERHEASEGRSASVKMIDSSPHQPILEKKEGMRGFQPVNPVHGRIVTDLLRQYAYQAGIPMQEMGIIVPFRSGVYAYRKWLRDAALDQVEVGTIHTYQGREKRVIIFDTMMTGEPNQYGKIRHYTVRPFDEEKNGLSVPRLLNVALSRAKDRLILVADLRHIEAVYSAKFLGRLVRKAEEIGDLIQ